MSSKPIDTQNLPLQFEQSINQTSETENSLSDNLTTIIIDHAMSDGYTSDLSQFNNGILDNLVPHLSSMSLAEVDVHALNLFSHIHEFFTLLTSNSPDALLTLFKNMKENPNSFSDLFILKDYPIKTELPEPADVEIAGQNNIPDSPEHLRMTADSPDKGLTNNSESDQPLLNQTNDLGIGVVAGVVYMYIQRLVFEYNLKKDTANLDNFEFNNFDLYVENGFFSVMASIDNKSKALVFAVVFTLATQNDSLGVTVLDIVNQAAKQIGQDTEIDVMQGFSNWLASPDRSADFANGLGAFYQIILDQTANLAESLDVNNKVGFDELLLAIVGNEFPV